jgi:cbb3-type cytochrome oxidase subunit 3
MFEEYLTSIENQNIFAIGVTVLFFIMFVLISIWTFRINKKYIKDMENLPLDKK